jgi:hypothetical protein
MVRPDTLTLGDVSRSRQIGGVLMRTGAAILLSGLLVAVAAGESGFSMDRHGWRAARSADASAAATDTGDTAGFPDWMALGPYGGDVADAAASTVNGSIVLAGLAPAAGGGGLYRSTDAAASWTDVAQLSGRPVYDRKAATAVPSGRS